MKMENVRAEYQERIDKKKRKNRGVRDLLEGETCK